MVVLIYILEKILTKIFKYFNMCILFNKVKICDIIVNGCGRTFDP